MTPQCHVWACSGCGKQTRLPYWAQSSWQLFISIHKWHAHPLNPELPSVRAIRAELYDRGMRAVTEEAERVVANV